MAKSLISAKSVRTIEVYSVPVIPRIGVAIGGVLLLIALWSPFAPYPHWLLTIGLFASSFLVLLPSVPLAMYPRVLLRFTPEGLYVNRYGTLFPWGMIARASSASLGARMNEARRIAAAITSRYGSEERNLLMLELTAAGQKKYRNKSFIPGSLVRVMRAEESVCVPLSAMDCRNARCKFKSIKEVVQAINQRAEASASGSFGSASTQDDAGVAPQRNLRKKGSDSESKEQPLQALSAVLVTVGLGMVAVLRGLYKAGRAAKLAPDSSIPVEQVNQAATSAFAVFLVVVFVIGLIVVPISLISALPGVFKFITGTKRYRIHWIMMQSLAWMLYVGFSIYWASHFRSNDPLFGRVLIGLMACVPAGIATYLMTLSLMPEGFFDSERIGKRVRIFYNCNSLTGIRIISWAVGIPLMTINFGVLWLFSDLNTLDLSAPSSASQAGPNWSSEMQPMQNEPQAGPGRFPSRMIYRKHR